MSEDSKTVDTEQSQELSQDRLATLKARADRMGLQYHPSIGADKLSEKIKAAQAGEATGGEAAAGEQAKPQATAETEGMKRKRLKQEALKLVRIRLTCMNPLKKEWDGEIITCGNAAVGTVRKFIPFQAEEGYHVPAILLKVLQDRQCQVFYTVKAKNGVAVRKGKLIKEFAIEILPPLTAEELKDLAQRQAMAGAVD